MALSWAELVATPWRDVALLGNPADFVDRHLCLAARFRQPAGEDCELQIGERRVKPGLLAGRDRLA